MSRLLMMPRLVQIHTTTARIAGTGAVIVAVLAATSVYAAEAWKSKNIAQWTAQDIQRVLTDSPWAQQASAAFNLAADDEPPPPAPLPTAAQNGLGAPANPPGVRWDGGVGRARGSNPTLNVLIRWDSAFPVREALQRSEGKDHEAYLAASAGKDYIVSIIGLVPAGRYRSIGRPESESRSDDTIDSHNPEEMLEGLMAASRLVPRGKPPISPDDAKLDASTGTLHIFFPKTDAISLSDKEVSFTTRFGALTVQKQFRVKDMVYRGKLEL